MASTVRFADRDVLVQVVPVTVVGSEDTSSIATRVSDAYQRAEESIKAVAESVTGTIAHLAGQATRPRQVEVAFGIAVSAEGNVVLVKGKAEATLAITLTYDVQG